MSLVGSDSMSTSWGMWLFAKAVYLSLCWLVQSGRANCTL